MRGADVVATMLEAYGVKHVFGLPGDTSMAWYDALRSSAVLKHVVCRDERSAAYMADGYARVGYRPGVCEVPSGGGVTYAVPGLAEADASRVPLVLISSDVATTSEDREALTALDDQLMLRAVTRWNTKVRRIDMLPRAVRSAFRHATSGRTGAVQISLPEDVLSGSAELDRRDLYAESQCRTYPAFRTRPDPELAERAAVLLAGAQRPVILAGGGIHHSQAWEELEQFVRTTRIPVVTSINGKGAISEISEFALGVVGGNGGSRAANEVVGQADLVFCLGSRLNSTTTKGFRLFGPEAKIVQVDIDPSQLGHNASVELGLMADLRLALRDLCEAVGERFCCKAPPWEGWRCSARRAVDRERRELGERLACQTVPLDPCRVVRAVEESLPADTSIVLDAGTPTPYFAAYCRVRVAGHLVIAARGHGALGYAVPAAVGVKMARPGQGVVAVFGDGSMGMVMGELETLVRTGTSIILVHLRNDCYGWIKALQHLYFHDRYHGVEFHPAVSHVEVARSHGLRAHRVETGEALGEALARAHADQEPTFIEVPVRGPVGLLPPVDSWQRDSQLSPGNRARRSY